MPTAQSVLASLHSKASEKTRATYVRHGHLADRTLGVSMADLKLIAKSLKGEQSLALELYATGIMDAMYLAGIVANGAKMTLPQLQSWADAAAGMNMISEYTVPWVTIEHPEGRALALKWIQSKKEHVAAAGWRSYAGLLATRPDDALDLPEIERLLSTAVQNIQRAQGRERYTMNGFIISVGAHVQPLLAHAKRAAKAVGTVAVDVGDTACQVPVAAASLHKLELAHQNGKKRKTIRC